jgi:hypothetical protein
MYCKDCGTQISDEANFCWKCGSQQNADLRDKEMAWESCEIQMYGNSAGTVLSNLFGLVRVNYRFVAQGVGPNGIYTIAENSCVNNKDLTKTLNGVITTLSQSGWESDGKGEYWYSYGFNSPLKYTDPSGHAPVEQWARACGRLPWA